MDVNNAISLITGVFGIAGTVGGVVTWLVARNNAKIADSITKALTPLSYEMKELNSHLKAINVEHKEFKEILDEHGDCIHDHDKRITVLEKIGGMEK